MEAVIRTSIELQTLKVRKLRRGIRRIVLKMPGPKDDIRKAEKEINRSLSACGCEVAAVFLLIGIVVIVPRFLLNLSDYDLTVSQTLLKIFGFLSIFVLVGKITGLMLAEWRLRYTIDRLISVTRMKQNEIWDF